MQSIFVAVIVIFSSFSLHADSVEFFTQEPEVPSYFDRVINQALGRLFEKPNVRLIQEDGRVFLAGKDVEGKKKLAFQLVNSFENTVSNWAAIDWKKNVDITDTIPSRIRNLGINQPMATDGVNCHSTTMYLNGFIEHLSYVNNEEFSYYIDNFCTRIDSMVPGAVGILSYRSMFSHSFQTISNNIIFQKKSLSRSDPLRFYLVKDYKNTEFYKCQPAPFVKCMGQYSEIRHKLNRLNSIYEQILVMGIDIDRREEAIRDVVSLLEVVRGELKNRPDDFCSQDLTRYKLRLESLQDVGIKIKGRGFYQRDKGLFHNEPKM